MESLHSWWEVPCIAYFCSLFKTAFRLFEFGIEDLELGFLLDGTSSDTCLIRDLIICLLRGCYQTKNVTFLNWELYLYDILQKVWVKEEKQSNPLSHHSTFSILPLRTKVEILHSLCEYRLDIIDVAEVMKVVDTRRLRVQPLGRDQQGNVYWYFYGLRLYREECLIAPENLKKKWEEEWKKECEKHFNGNATQAKKRKRGRPKKILSDAIHLESDGEEKNRKKIGSDCKKQPRWTVVCNTLEDWYKLAEKFHKSKSPWERKLYKVLSGGFLDALAALVAENEKNANLSLLEQFNQHNESIRTELQESGSENRSAELVPKQRQKQNEEISEYQHEVKKGARTYKARGSRTKQQKERRWCSSRDEVVVNHTEQQLDNEKDNVKLPCDPELYKDLYKVLNCIKSHRDSWPFLEPVDESYAPGYYNVVKDPIDLSTIEEKLQQKAYRCWKEMQNDIKKMVQNCNLYNGSHSEYALMAQTIWRNFQKQIKKTFIDTTCNATPKKRVRFCLPEDNSELPEHIINEDDQSAYNEDDQSAYSEDDQSANNEDEHPLNNVGEQDSSNVDKDHSVNEKDGDNTENKNCLVAKVETKVARRRRRKRRPPGMRAIEMLAKAAEKALKDVEANNLKESLSNEDKSLPAIGTAFPNLKVSTVQSHPPSLLAKCMSIQDKSAVELTSNNSNSSDCIESTGNIINSFDLMQCSDLVTAIHNDQIEDSAPSINDCCITQTCNTHGGNQDLNQCLVKDHVLSNITDHSKETENKRDNNRYSPLILYLSSDNKSQKAKENITHHNYALTERTDLAAQNYHAPEVEDIQSLEKSQNVNTDISSKNSVALSSETAGDAVVTESLGTSESSDSCFPSVSSLKSVPFFTGSQERIEVEQSVDATVLNSSSILDCADHEVRLTNEDQPNNDITNIEPCWQSTILQPPVTSQLCFQPLNQFSSSHNKLLQNETPLNNRISNFNQFHTNGQYSLNEHCISSTIPHQMMLAQLPNHLIPHSSFSSTDRRNMPSTIEQFIPSQQYMYHPSSTLTISHPYQTLSTANHVQEQPSQSMNFMFLPSSSTEQSVSNENGLLGTNKITVNKETSISAQNNYQQNMLPSAIPNHLINITNQNKRLMSSAPGEAYSQHFRTPGCLLPNSSYPTFTAADSNTTVTDRSLGVPAITDVAKDWNSLLNNNHTSVTTTVPFPNPVYSRPTILKHPPIILQKPRTTVKKSESQSYKSQNGKQSSENSIMNQISTQKSAVTTLPMTSLSQATDTNKAVGDKVDLILPPLLSFHHPSTTQANSQYLFENLEPSLKVNVPGSPPQYFPYPPEKLVTNQNINAFYPSHLVNSVGMPPLMTSHGASFYAPSINTTRNQQTGIPPVLTFSGKQTGSVSPLFTSGIKQVGNIDSLKSIRPTSLQLPGMI